MNTTKIRNQVQRIYHLDTKETVTQNVKNTEAKLLELNLKLKSLDSVAYSLDTGIISLKRNFERVHELLNKNMAFKIAQHDSVFGPFEKSTGLRYYLKDNYKKSVVEVRKDINRNKLNYVKDLDEKVFSLAASWEDLGYQLFALVDKRDKTKELIYKTKAELVRRDKLPRTVLAAYQTEFADDNKEDICWIIKNSFGFQKTFYLSGIFLEKQKIAYSVIETENRAEGIRHAYVDRELYRRRRKYRKIVVNNTRVVTAQTRVVRKEE